MTLQDQKSILSHLNSIAPDTFNEGEFGPWKFTSINQEGKTFTLSFANSIGESEVIFDFDGDIMQEGYLSNAFFNVINESIIDWEGSEGDDWGY